jgi:hypothetical protein
MKEFSETFRILRFPALAEPEKKVISITSLDRKRVGKLSLTG